MRRYGFDPEEDSEFDGGFPLNLSLQGDLGKTLIQLRALRAFDTRAMSYAIQRTVRCAARRPIDELFDDLALQMGMTAHRVAATALLLDGPGVFAAARGRRKIDYGSLTFDFWADSIQRLDSVRDRLFRLVGEQLSRREMFTIDWRFQSAHGLSSASFDEMADPPSFDEAYPTLGEPVAGFVARYLASQETVLILQGPPGTGKSRLVRAILAALSVRKGDSARVLYTADQRAQGRKIIFTTNLPNVGDIDEALVRPGRCFATVRTRALELAEAGHSLRAWVKMYGYRRGCGRFPWRVSTSWSTTPGPPVCPRRAGVNHGDVR